MFEPTRTTLPIDPPAVIAMPGFPAWVLRGRDRDGGLYALDNGRPDEALIPERLVWATVARVRELALLVGRHAEQRHLLDPADRAFAALAPMGVAA